VSKGVQFKVIAVRACFLVHGCRVPDLLRCARMCAQCIPSNGQVDRNTEIFTEGEPLRDLEKIHILPIYETCALPPLICAAQANGAMHATLACRLPNREKNITPEQRFEKYLEPFFSGRSQMLTRGEEVVIDGVNFKVVAAEPDKGEQCFADNRWRLMC